MATIPHHSGEAVQVNDAVFGVAANPQLISQAVTRYLAGGRSGSKATKNRSAVRGGGRKPWRQKKTGRARHGTRRSPIWRGGGHTFSLQPRDFSQKFPRKMFAASVRCALSECARSEVLTVVDDIKCEEPRVSAFRSWAQGCGVDPAQSYLLLVLTADECNDNLELATRNLQNVEVIKVSSLNAYLLLRAKRVVVSSAAVKEVEAWLN